MSEKARVDKADTTPQGYEYPPLVSVVCPKCGHMSSFRLTEIMGYRLEYAGVCGTNVEPGLWCDAMLTVQVTAHLAPVADRRHL